jgi:hypothetical protein
LQLLPTHPPFPTAVGRFTDSQWWVSPFFVFDQEQKDQLKPPENKLHHPSEGGILMFYHRTGVEMVFETYLSVGLTGSVSYLSVDHSRRSGHAISYPEIHTPTLGMTPHQKTTS